MQHHAARHQLYPNWLLLDPRRQLRTDHVAAFEFAECNDKREAFFDIEFIDMHTRVEHIQRCDHGKGIGPILASWGLDIAVGRLICCFEYLVS